MQWQLRLSSMHLCQGLEANNLFLCYSYWAMQDHLRQDDDANYKTTLRARVPYSFHCASLVIFILAANIDFQGWLRK